MGAEKVRVESIQCPHCDFNNPEGTETCFGCGETLSDDAIRKLVTVRRRRHPVEAINLSDLKALRARVRALSQELCTRRRQIRTGRVRGRTERVIVATPTLESA